MVSAAREIGRLLGFYAVDRLKGDVEVRGVGQADKRRMERMSDAELLAIVQGTDADVASGRCKFWARFTYCAGVCEPPPL